MRPTQTPSDIDFVKLAVIIDCEGNIRINANRKKSHHELHITVGNKDFELLRWCEARFGGRVYDNFTKTPTRADLQRWVVYGQQAAYLLERCLPHFIIKRRQAEIALRFQASYGRPRARIREADRQFRESLRADLLALTGRGPKPTTGSGTPEKRQAQRNLFAKDFSG